MENRIGNYAVPTVYYSDLDSGERIKKGKSIKSYMLAVDDFKKLCLTTDANEQATYANNVIRHIICCLKHDKYNQPSKILLKSVYAVCAAGAFIDDIDDSLKCGSVATTLKSMKVNIGWPEIFD